MAERSPEASSHLCVVLLCGLQDPTQDTTDCAPSHHCGHRSLEVMEVEKPFSITRSFPADWHLGCYLVS